MYLGHPATSLNALYEDAITSAVHTARHVLYDEAHFSTNNRPPYAQQLIDIEKMKLANDQLQEKNRPTLPSPISPEPPIYNIIPLSPLFPQPIPALPLHPQHNKHCHVIPNDEPALHATVDSEHSDFVFSLNPFGPSLDIQIQIKGDHPTLGLEIVTNTDNGRLPLKTNEVLTTCSQSTTLENYFETGNSCCC
jgi:hypothetical protein